MMSLDEKEVDKSAVVQFEKWIVDAVNAEVNEPNAMVLSTVDKDGLPHSRIVLLRDISKKGFNFYTNYNSDKALDIEQQHHVALNFFWVDIERQVRVEGKAEKLSLVESVEYYKNRPRESQISAWASPQSKVVSSRVELDAARKSIEEHWKDKTEIEKPDFWGGYTVIPTMIEFWQGRPGRLHDRIRYRMHENLWIVERLAP